MKKLSTALVILFVMGLMAGTAFALSYCQDYLEPGNPGGRTTGLKTCDTAVTVNPGETFAVDIWTADLTETIISGGFELAFDPAQVSLTSVQAYDNVDIAGGPWDGGATTKISEPYGPGSYVVALVQLSCAVPDAGGDVIVAKLTFQCLANGTSSISVRGIDGFDTTVGCLSGINYDPQLGTNTLALTQGVPPTCDPADCDDGNICTTEECINDVCVNTPNTSPCNDGNACTTNDTCSAGTCVGGADLVCTDGNSCTTDSCNPASGCVYANNTAPCDDGNACTTGDACSGGSCAGGADLVCTDGNSCTTDTCNPASGCVYTPISCDDTDLCTTDTCDPATGCVYTPVNCDDGDPNTVDSCNPATGQCINTPPGCTEPCTDNNACTENDACVGDVCVGTPITCDDSSACTTDSCNPATGCVYTPISCDDTDLCTTDTCDPATGCVYTPVNCDDGDPNTVDSCNPATGQCINTPPGCTEPCTDNNACTENDACVGDVCVGTPITCNDASLCTTDSCNPASGCVYTPITCDDGVGCTDDSCNPASGCVHVPNDGNCTDDGFYCTGMEVCDPINDCVSAGDPCSAGFVCNEDTDSCDPVSGITVSVDIDPYACPNPLNLESTGKIRVTILGTSNFDVMSIDKATVMLSREGIDGAVTPRLFDDGYMDRETPDNGDLCGCADCGDKTQYTASSGKPDNCGRDGYADLSAYFKISQLVEVLKLDEVAGQTIPLTLTGKLMDGTDISGKDCIVAQGICKGDSDCDGDVDGTDSHKIKAKFGWITSSSSDADAENLSFDFDDDGDIDATDVNGFLTIFGTKYNGTCGFVECRGDFDCDRDVDGTDSKSFKNNFGRTALYNPCTDGNPCTGDFDADGDCDGSDAAGFKVDFGRGLFQNPCRGCVEQ